MQHMHTEIHKHTASVNYYDEIAIKWGLLRVWR